MDRGGEVGQVEPMTNWFQGLCRVIIDRWLMQVVDLKRAWNIQMR
jgi:hypothetical protein